MWILLPWGIREIIVHEGVVICEVNSSCVQTASRTKWSSVCSSLTKFLLNEMIMKSFFLVAVVVSFILLCHPNKAQATSTGQAHAYTYSHTPTTTILAVKSLYSNSGGTDGTRDDFARLNKRYRHSGPITRESVHDAVVKTKRQRPSQDIVKMGAASWNS